MDFKYPYTDFHELNLDWFLAEFKKLTADWLQLQHDWEDEQQAFQDLHDYVQDYFANLNLYQEVHDILYSDEMQQTIQLMLSSITASELPIVVANQIASVVASQIAPVVAAQLPNLLTSMVPSFLPAAVAGEAADWLAAHVDPDTGYVIDDTLSIALAAADAKATGDAIQDEWILNINKLNTTWNDGYYKSTGVIEPSHPVSNIYSPKIRAVNVNIAVGGDRQFKVTRFNPTDGTLYDDSGWLTATTEFTGDYLYGISVATQAPSSISHDDVLSKAKISIRYYDYVIDDTLSIARVAADAKATGDAIQNEWILNINKLNTSWDDGYYDLNGNIVSSNPFSNIYSPKIRAVNVNIAVGGDRQFKVTRFNPNDGTLYDDSGWLTAATEFTGDYLYGISVATQAPSSISHDDVLSKAKITIKYDDFMINGKWFNKKAAFIGDSITAGANVSPGHIYYELLNDEISFSSVYADGVVGSAFSSLATGGYTPIVQRTGNIPADTDLIVIFAGTNDFGQNTPMGVITDTTDVSFYGAVAKTIIDIITAMPAARLVFMTPLHRTGNIYLAEDTPNNQGLVLLDYVNALKAVAAKYSIPVIDTYSISGMNPAIPVIKSTYITDGLHPNDAGHQLLADRIIDYIEML